MQSLGFGFDMSAAYPCRLLIDPPQSGAWNMAVDEALLRDAAESGTATLRLYEWNEPTLSLGYFQKHADRVEHASSATAAVVRRQTGGGAILHDREMTYSVCLPRSYPLSYNVHRLYRMVHETIAQLLRSKLPQDIAPTAIKLARPDPLTEEYFLCFRRRSEGDIIFVAEETHGFVEDHKIVGSAQRRTRGAILQHGSILLGRSELAPELAGLGDLCDTKKTTTCLANELSVRLTQAFKFEVRERVLGDQSRALAVALQDQKYGNRLWTEKC